MRITQNKYMGIALPAFFAAILFAMAAFGTRADSQQPPAVGMKAPEFSLTSQEGKQLGLKDFRGKWVVLYFYPCLLYTSKSRLSRSPHRAARFPCRPRRLLDPQLQRREEFLRLVPSLRRHPSKLARRFLAIQKRAARKIR